MIPTNSGVDVVSPGATFFIYGAIQSSTQLFTHLIGPLLVAANNRKSYEITMGGTMISICIGSGYILGATISSVFSVIGNSVQSPLLNKVIISSFFLLSTMPFIIPAVDEYYLRQ